MKQIHEIRTMDNGAVIDEFTGIVQNIYPPTTPTQPQIDKGIHKQAIIVADQAGNKITINLNVASLHMDQSSVNQMFVFKSTKDDKGSLRGLHVSKWTDKEGIEKCGVDVWGSATFFATGAEGATHTVKDAAVRDVDPLLWAENYGDFYRAVYDVFARKMEGTGITADGITPIIATKMIPMERNGKLDGVVLAFLKNRRAKSADQLIDPDVAPDEQPSMDMTEKELENTDSTPDSSDEPTPWREIKDSSGNIISEMNKDDLIDLCIKLIPFHASTVSVIQAGFEAAMRSRDAMEISYTDIYDVYEIMLNQDHDMTAIASAYDEVNGVKSEDSSVVCKRILMDQKTFVTLIENHEPASV